MEDTLFGSIDIAQVLRTFIAQAKTHDLVIKNRYPEQLAEFKFSVSFGQGNVSGIPWIAILGKDQRVPKGIYPVFLYYKSNDYLILAYGVSETEAPPQMWKDAIHAKLRISEHMKQRGIEAKRYGSSYVAYAYDMASKRVTAPDFDAQVRNDLATVLEAYRKELSAVPAHEIPLSSYYAGTLTLANAKHSSSQPPLNQILYGPPGTGKTYAAIDAALEILDPDYLRAHQNDRASLKARFDTLEKNRQLRFVTFHQSFSYEDFIEGIRAESTPEGRLSYPIVDGVFKELCSRATVTTLSEASALSAMGHARIDMKGRRIWKMSLGAAGGDEAYIFDDCMKEGKALLGYGYGLDFSQCRNREDVAEKIRAAGYDSPPNDYAATAVNNFVNKIKPRDLIVVTDGNFRFRAIGEVTGDYEHILRDDHYRQSRQILWQTPYHPSLSYKELMNNQFSQMTLYELKEGSIDLAKLEGLLNPPQPIGSVAGQSYVLIIDEINRGNISRIFGELITLIEPSKRAGAEEALEAILPYSKDRFSVPANVYLIGTMNTADRSLANMDAALRRRFVFKEMPPNPQALSDIYIGQIPVEKLLTKINQRIEALLDRDHCLGHAYFIPLRTDPSVEKLAGIFRNQVIPLLQEYFFQDWQHIQWVLNDHRKPFALQFVKKSDIDSQELFGDGVTLPVRPQLWQINEAAFSREGSYLGVIDHLDATE